MKKIISLYERNYDGDRLVRDEVVPGAEWVLKGEGVATLKWDGTCCLIFDGHLYARYDAKGGKTPPADFMPAQPGPDPVTGHWPGWVPVTDDPRFQWHQAAWTTFAATHAVEDYEGRTFELIGPKVQGNPERQENHRLVLHGDYFLPDAPREFLAIREYLASRDMEGIVWWREPGNSESDLVKIKGRDFGLTRLDVIAMNRRPVYA